MPILIKKLGVLIVIAVSTALLPHSAKTEINPKSGQKNQSSSKEGNVTLANAGDQAVIAEEIANLSNQATIPNLTKALINTTMARKNKKRHYTPKPPTPAPTPTPIPTPIINSSCSNSSAHSDSDFVQIIHRQLFQQSYIR